MAWLIPFVGALIGGGAAGFVIGYLIAERRARAIAGGLQSAAAASEQKSIGLAGQLTQQQGEISALRVQFSESEKSQAALSAQLVSAQQNIAEQKKLLDDANTQLTQAFAAVSQEALQKNNEAFLALAKERFATLSTEAAGTLEHRKAQIEGLLKPLAEIMGQYQLRLGEIEKSRVESYSMLREQLGTLAETQRTLNTQTNQLVTALSRPATRGQWGEISLRKLVELAGMSNRVDFVEQVTLDGEDGKLRPDMIVRLPGNRDVVIDCKASLEGFLDAAAATDEDSRRVCLQRHSQQVRTRARELWGKAYWSQFPRSPEFVVMFLPGEAFLYAAAEHDGSLMEDCLTHRVLIATPTTLISLLKTIEFGWRQEAITDNAEKIRILGVELYERIATLAGHFDKLGSSLSGCVSTYNNALGSFEARMLVTARKISELGARNEKELPELEPIDLRARLPVAALGQGE
jgi:DNA recombination protein RmuC